jgi:hypothetical protein
VPVTSGRTSMLPSAMLRSVSWNSSLRFVFGYAPRGGDGYGAVAALCGSIRIFAWRAGSLSASNESPCA